MVASGTASMVALLEALTVMIMERPEMQERLNQHFNDQTSRNHNTDTENLHNIEYMI